MRAYAAAVPGDFTGWDKASGGAERSGFFGGGLTNLLDNVIIHIAEFAGGLALLALIVGAWQYLLAGGDETRAEAGKKTITWAIVGIVLVLLFYLIIVAITGGIFQNKSVTGP